MIKIFCSRLEEARKNIKKSQKEVGKILGISNVAYGAYERGDNEPSLATLVKICECLNVSADWLLGLDSHDDISHKLNAMKDEVTQAQESLKRMVERMNEMRKVV